MNHETAEQAIRGAEVHCENSLPNPPPPPDDITTVTDDIEPVSTSAMNMEENESPAEDHEVSLLGLTLNSLCTAVDILVRNVHTTKENDRAIFTAMEATYQIFQKLRLDENVYHDLENHALRPLQAAFYPTATEISSKMSAERSMHGVLHNIALKLVGGIYGLLYGILDLLEELVGELTRKLDIDINLMNSKLSPLLESLNCTLGSLNRALDPLPGGKYAMEAELYNVHLTPHKSPLVATRLSEPTISYCCTTYRQLAVK